MADGSRQTGGPFLLRTCEGTLRSATDSRCSSTGSFLDVEADHLRLEKRQYGLNEQEVHHLHLFPVLVRELDMLIFARIKQKLHVSSGEWIAHAIWDDTQDSSCPT